MADSVALAWWALGKFASRPHAAGSHLEVLEALTGLGLGGFRAVRCPCSIGAAGVKVGKAMAAALGLSPGDRVGVTPLPEPVRRGKPRGAR